MRCYVVARLADLQIHCDADDLAGFDREVDGIRDRQGAIRDNDALIPAEGQRYNRSGVDGASARQVLADFCNWQSDVDFGDWEGIEAKCIG